MSINHSPPVENNLRVSGPVEVQHDPPSRTDTYRSRSFGHCEPSTPWAGGESVRGGTRGDDEAGAKVVEEPMFRGFWVLGFFLAVLALLVLAGTAVLSPLNPSPRPRSIMSYA